MQQVEKTIVIEAPREVTFAYIDNTPNLVDVWPSMLEARDFEALPNGGKRFRWVYKMAGFPFEGVSEDVEWLCNERIVSKTMEGIDSTICWQFDDEGEGTRLTLTAEYNVPMPLIGWLAETVLVMINDQELEVMLTYLKARVEWANKVRLKKESDSGV
ncbi:MAG: SRPBCC family protein [Anaerolineae bacterium]|nr:SRPBCC family protein [Anaerolineae bacterium]